MLRTLRLPVLGLGLGGFILAGVWIESRHSRIDRPYNEAHKELLQALLRPTEARLSGETIYKAFRRPVRSSPLSLEPIASSSARGSSAPEESSPPRELKLPAGLAKRIQIAGESRGAPEDRATLAVLNLARGEAETAVSRLRNAQKAAPSDPRFLNDLAAALLALHQAQGDPWAALEAVERAAQSDLLEPSPAARFNLALALERSGARARAIAAWKRYLDLDSRSSWAGEAEARLGALKAAIDRDGPSLPARPAATIADFPGNPWARRQFGERELLTRWAQQTLSGRPGDADATLEEAEAIAAKLGPDAGRLLEASLGAIREAERSHDWPRLDLLARGHQLFGEAFLLLREERNSEALRPVADSIRALQAAGSPFQLRARVLQAWIVDEPDWNELRRIGKEAEASGFAAIVAEERRIAAYRTSLQGRFEPAADLYQEAGRRYAALGEREAAGVIAILRAELLNFLKKDQEASREIAAALAAGPAMADPLDRYSVFAVASVAAASRFSHAAVELRREALDACRGLSERPLCAVDSWQRIASLIPETDAAEAAFQRAEDLLPKTPPSEGKIRTSIDLVVARARWLSGEGHSQGDKEEAAEFYGEAALRYEERKLAVSAADARSKRARLLKDLGHVKEAKTEYRAALETFRLWDRTERFKPEPAEKRSPAALRNVYEELIGLELSASGQGVSPAAFLYSEEMRDRLAPRRTAELKLPSERDLSWYADVPPGTAILEYAVLPGRAVAWVLAERRLDQVSLALPDDYGQRIKSLADKNERTLDVWKENAGALFETFLAPVLRRLPVGTNRLVLVPDSQLYGLPFRALWDPSSREYLDEKYFVTLAPSVRQYFSSSGEGRFPRTLGGLPVVSAGFTTFAPNLGLKPLPRALTEADAIRRVYGGTVLDCPVTDWATFVRCAPRAPVLHLATHAQIDSVNERSWLAFEGETVTLDRLWKDLPDLPEHPLVVLSACQSVAARGEGLGGLARPFLASGARAVVGTLWKIDDDDAAVMFPAFHRAYQASGKIPEALSEARKNMENWREKPWVWGTVEMLGIGNR